jgi:excinuclease ABC subunit B
VLSGRKPGSTPFTLFDFFPKDFLLFIDESHVTIPQVRGMSGGDFSRKKNLIDFGFRLPSAYDNRPLVFDEFKERINQVVYVSATPSQYEKDESEQVVEQIIRPTGLVDPEIEIRPINGQVVDLLSEIEIVTKTGGRVLVTTLTTKMAEDLTEFFDSKGVKVKYIHHSVETLERMEIIRDLRLGVFDVLVGINLLREGLDIPEVALVAILDADKEGFLRGETALVQTVGRAARNAEGRVIFYADVMTRSINAAIVETSRRRAIQQAYNTEHGITPKTIKKDVRDIIEISKSEGDKSPKERAKVLNRMSLEEREKLIKEMTDEMLASASRLEFERAAYLRDRIGEIRRKKS